MIPEDAGQKTGSEMAAAVDSIDLPVVPGYPSGVDLKETGDESLGGTVVTKAPSADDLPEGFEPV